VVEWRDPVRGGHQIRGWRTRGLESRFYHVGAVDQSAGHDAILLDAFELGATLVLPMLLTPGG
jgi:hypothetical protein